jgi:hypothetical protein
MSQVGTLTKKAKTLANDLGVFYAQSVGRNVLNFQLQEFSMLVEWQEAIKAAQAAALKARSWGDVEDMDKLLDECEMWLDVCNAS